MREGLATLAIAWTPVPARICPARVFPVLCPAMLSLLLVIQYLPITTKIFTNIIFFSLRSKVGNDVGAVLFDQLSSTFYPLFTTFHRCRGCYCSSLPPTTTPTSLPTITVHSICHLLPLIQHPLELRIVSPGSGFHQHTDGSHHVIILALTQVHLLYLGIVSLAIDNMVRASVHLQPAEDKFLRKVATQIDSGSEASIVQWVVRRWEGHFQSV